MRALVFAALAASALVSCGPPPSAGCCSRFLVEAPETAYQGAFGGTDGGAATQVNFVRHGDGSTATLRLIRPNGDVVDLTLTRRSF